MNFLKIKKLNLMLGGEKPSSFPKEECWFGVDSGTNFLLNNGINPICSCGDFDSFFVKEEIQDILVIKKENQNLTDTEFTLNYILKYFKNIKEINLYGATGKRLDHFFANILLLSNDKFNNIKISIIDDNNLIRILKVGENELFYKENYEYISFVPIYEETFISIKNAKYNVNNFELSLNRANATSNEFISKGSINLTTNKKCLVIYSKD